jgi:putative transposase
VIRQQKALYEAEKKFLPQPEFQRNLIQLKKDNPWLSSISRQTLIIAMKDCYTAYSRFFRHISEYPTFRSRFHKSFYTRYDKVKFDGDRRVYFESIGWIKVSEPERIVDVLKFKNPRVKYSGKHWYLTFGVDFEPEESKTTDEVIGIDLGIKKLAIASNGNRYKNINNSSNIKKLTKRKKRLQRKSSRKYQDGRDKPNSKIEKGEKVKKSKNQKKIERQIAVLSQRLTNTRHTYMCQVISDLVKTHPKAIVMESLKVSNMLKNGKLSRSIQEQSFGAFLRQMEWKCKQLGIEFIQVPWNYPSSKRCNSCGHIYKDLKLNQRAYTCESCGSEIDRDLNASYNLRDYYYNYSNESQLDKVT